MNFKPTFIDALYEAKLRKEREEAAQRDSWPVDLAMLWLVGLLLAVLFTALAFAPADPCADYEEGTDIWLECTTGEEVDLNPVVQDEAQTFLSQGRMEL